MRAVLLTDFGDIDGLKFRDEVEEPVLKPTRVLIRVKAVALNHLDIWVRKGALPVKPELPHILGSDISGVVEAVGEEVINVKEGEEVLVIPSLSCGICQVCQGGYDNLCKDYDIIGLRSKGGYAEYISVPVRNVIKKPANLSFEEASSYPLTFLTSWNALVDKGKVDPSKVVFIWAGASGVGTASIQIAKLFGAFVITTVGNEEKMEKCKELGADIVLNHYRDDIEHEVFSLFPEGVDIVVDHIGRKTFGRSASILRRGGVLSFLGTTTGGSVELNLRSLFVKEIQLKGVYMGRRGNLFKITNLFEKEMLKPVIDQIFPLEEARQAHRYMEESRHFGKIVLRID